MTSAHAKNEFGLVPMPRSVERGEGVATLTPEWTISVHDLNPEDLVPAMQIAEDAFALFGWEWHVEKSTPDTPYILFKEFVPEGEPPALFVEQGYILRVEPGRVIVEAPTAAGRFYGAQTLRQLLRDAAERRTLPVLRIEDYPALEWRGLSDDISRGQVSTVEDFRFILQQLAYYKKNLYQPYIEDMFRFDVSPNVGANRGALTKTEMALLVEEARKHHVTLTPVFETLGHQDRLLSLPENRQYAEVQDPEKTPWSFAPVSEAAYEFVTRLIDEMAAATPSPFFHIGGDESWDVGEGLSREAVEKYGAGRVHADYYTRLVDYIRERHDRRTLLYADMLLKYPESLDSLAKDSILIDWRYAPAEEYPTIQTIREAGFANIFVSPGIWSWANFYPNYGKGFANVGSFVAAGKKAGVMGSITSSWGDWGAENLRNNNWPGYAFSAACEWEEGTPDTDEFLRRFVRAHHGVDSPSLAEALRILGWLDYLAVDYRHGLLHRRLHVRPLVPESRERMQKLESDMLRVRETIRRERGNARFRAQDLDGMDHAARRFLFVARRDLALGEIAKTLGDKSIRDLDADARDSIRTQLETLREELIGIVEEFTRLWLRDNKFPKIDDNLTRLNAQVGALQDLVARCHAGDLAQTPPPWGAWFWYPEEDPRKSTTVESPRFMRVFALKEIPITATLRCWADDRAVVHLNDRRVFRTTYAEDPKSADVRPFLRLGDNFLALDARNTYGAAGILLELELKMADGSTVRIGGDEHWRCTAAQEPDWRTITPSGDAWKPVMIVGEGILPPWEFLNW